MENDGTLDKILVDGWRINVFNQAEALSAIIDAARDQKPFSFFTLNLDHLVKLRKNSAFRRAYAHATYISADGEPVARLARRQNPNVLRTTGADLVEPLTLMCADAGLPIFLFGSRARTLSIAEQRLASICGGRLQISGSLSPSEDLDPQGEEADAAIQTIVSSGARVCFVALGAPKQEIFSARAIAQGANVGFICVGAALDFVAGEQIRAPTSFRSAQLEWLWRLCLDPRRLFWRYVQCAQLLANLTAWSLLSTRGAREREL
jgi:exopolysaccharide biosynthesis WecB/TagA/CpsF family protein